LVEDQQLFLSLLANHLQSEAEFDLVAQATDGEEGLGLYKKHQPDLVLLDMMIPRISGFELGERILQLNPHANLLAITSQMDAATTNRIHQIGFHGYVEKEQPIEVLQEAMLTVAEGGFYFTHLVRENRYKLRSDPNAIHKILSNREQEILFWVAEGLTSHAIAERLMLSPRTVENHRYRTMKKLNIETIPQLIKFVMQHELKAT